MSSRPSLLRFVIVLVTLLAVLHETHLFCSNIFANADLKVLFKLCTSGDLAKTVDEDTCIPMPTDFATCGVRPEDGTLYKCIEFNDALCTTAQEKGPFFICKSL